MAYFGECPSCKRNALVEKIENRYICEKCFEKIALMNAASEGIAIWLEETIGAWSKYDKRIDEIVEGYIPEIEKKYVNVYEQEQELLRKIRKEVEYRLCFYRQDELCLALFAVKEYIRRYLLIEPCPKWVYIEDITTINFIMKVLRNISEFENAPIFQLENGCSNLANAICLARRYVLVRNNIDILAKKEHCLDDICYEAVQSNDTENYFEAYLKSGKGEKQEDYIIQDPILKSRLEAEKKTPEGILDSLDDLIFIELGINRKELKSISNSCLLSEFNDENGYWKWTEGENLIDIHRPIFIIDKSKMIEIIDSDMLENILNLFSINRNSDKDERYLELFCFYEINENIVFGNFDLAQVVSIFEKFLLSGHFLDVYKAGLSSNKLIVQAQRNISKYFSYCVADLLFSNGYELPMEIYNGNKCIKAEIEHIEIDGKDILFDRQKKPLGDIDVLALNSKKKEILLIELKYYRPAMGYIEMFSRDKSLIVDKEVIRHIKARESAIALNSNAVVEFITGNKENGYLVKSILLTPRINYYGICQDEVEYLTWTQLLEAVENMEL